MRITNIMQQNGKRGIGRGSSTPRSMLRGSGYRQSNKIGIDAARHERVTNLAADIEYTL